MDEDSIVVVRTRSGRPEEVVLRVTVAWVRASEAWAVAGVWIRVRSGRAPAEAEGVVEMARLAVSERPADVGCSEKPPLVIAGPEAAGRRTEGAEAGEATTERVLSAAGLRTMRVEPEGAAGVMMLPDS